MAVVTSAHVTYRCSAWLEWELGVNMKRLILKCIIPFALSLSLNANADQCHVQCPVNSQNVGSYYDKDHFDWSNYDNDVHLLIGFGGSFLVAQSMINYAHVAPWQAAIIGTVVLGLAGTAKETMFDTYTSRTDIKTYWAGAAAGGIAVTLVNLNF